MGRIMKFGIDRLERRHLEVGLDCPNCGSARIIMTGGNGDRHLDSRICPKCGIEIILDDVCITVVNEAATKHAATADIAEGRAAVTIV